MITRRFQNTLNEIEGLIKKELWSAPCAVGDVSCREMKVLLAVSGGMDSMCLADMYHSVASGREMAIAHCNFNLRGEESDADEELVRNWADERGIRLHVNSFDTVQYAGRNGVSIEMAARELRYRWFADLCRENGYAYVAVAHHADDNAETLFLNLVRGTGLKGISGMKQISLLPYSSEQDLFRLVRPMLGLTRKQIEGYVHGHYVPYRNDSTNSSVEYRRNSLRHEVFPVLKRMNPSFATTVNREMRYFSEAEEIVSDWCAAAAGSVVRNEGPDAAVIDTLRLMEHRQWRYLLYYILEPFGFSSSVLESLESLLASDRTVSGKRFISGEYAVITERDCLRIVPADSLESADDEVVVVKGTGVYTLGDATFSVELCPWNEDMPLRQPKGTLAFDACRMTFPFVCRRWKRGDWMVPFGMKGRKKLSDLFADLRWHEAEKTSAVVIKDPEGSDADEHHVAGLLGVRMDAFYRITQTTEMVVRIRKQ